MNNFCDVVVFPDGLKMRVKAKAEVCRKFYNENPSILERIKERYPNASICCAERCYCDKCFTKKCIKVTEEFLKYE